MQASALCRPLQLLIQGELLKGDLSPVIQQHEASVRVGMKIEDLW